jgi:hypothetical protein
LGASSVQSEKQKEKQMSDYQKTFTSRKLDIMDTIIFDSRLKPVDKLVAYVILQHMGKGTAKCWPSEQRIAHLIGGVHVRTVQRSIERLVKAGWFSCTKRNGTVNVYEAAMERGCAAVYGRLREYKEASKAVSPPSETSNTCVTPDGDSGETSNTCVADSGETSNNCVAQPVTPVLPEHLQRGTPIKDEHLHRVAFADANAEPMFNQHTNEYFRKLYGSSADELFARYRAKPK